MLRELTHAQHGLLQWCFQDLSQEGAQGTHTCTAWPITAVFPGFESGGCSGNSHMHSMAYYSGVSRI